MFTTQRLRLRAYQPADEANLLALYNDPHIAPNITHRYVVPLNSDRFHHVKKLINDSVMFCILEELESGTFAGFTLFMPVNGTEKNRNATWGIALCPSHWYKGYGWEVGNFMVHYAFRHLASHRVTLTVVDGNDRAVALYKRIGFVEEGRTRKLAWINGGWRDLIHMGILENEWAALKQAHAEGTAAAS
ncbi:putative acetyltransferase (GNAT) domain containing protein [Lyophyllum shimeji]|uniref:Acetyltransferase (GNAT) domain containing protein n=1 Tax=Lyophyllum shimeji TaxID=47721 RepID=A0A9P3PMQ3_LYOSH|nr:putative acetyltransferase (GNAT) domain containing protein [Lyophyllum shimeji]